MLTVGRSAVRTGRESHECWIVSVSSVSPIVTVALSSEAELRQERRSTKLSSCVDAIAARSLCYVNSIRFQFASAIECNNHRNPTSQS
jgi:hypothetical protein